MRARIPLVLVGCGGHASDVLSVIDACNREDDKYLVLGYIDDDARADDRRLRVRGVSRLGTLDDAARIDAVFAIGVGYPRSRASAVERLSAAVEPAPPLVHPRAILAPGVQIGAGSIVFESVSIGPLATIGRFGMLGRAAVVGHDASVADLVSLMPGCVTSGDVSIGVGALVGASATVLEGRVIGAWAQLGAGSVLTADLPSHCTAVGVPARITRGPQDHG